MQYETLQLQRDPDQLLVTYTVEPASTSEENLRLLASWAATGEPVDREKSRSAAEDPELR